MSPEPSVWILSGMSGAGRATARAALVKAGVEVTDNLSPALLPDWARLPRQRPAVALVDARQGQSVANLVPPSGVRVLYLTAADRVLARRQGESSLPHPCTAAGEPLTAIHRERELLGGLRAAADTVIDTSDLDAAELGARVARLVSPPGPEVPLRLTVSSFGYKFGIDEEADWVIDVRFLRNPFWDPDLRPRTGLDQAVRDHVLGDPRSRELCVRLAELLTWTSAQYAEHGRRHLHVAVGCTGGRHRSVVIAEELAGMLRGEGVEVTVRHRDVATPDPR
jgi:UPF0042 nucleotide-binding protein